MKKSFFKTYLLRVYYVIIDIIDEMNLKLFYRLRIMSPHKTVKKIIKNNYSIARFGNGEFDQMFGYDDEEFQKSSVCLSEKLKQVFLNDNKSFLICLAGSLNSLRGFNSYSSQFWSRWNKNHKKTTVIEIRKIMKKNYSYGDALITRPYMDYRSSKHAKKMFALLKRIWNNKEIIIIEGAQTRLGVGNDLFDNTKSIKRIIAPSVNAFESYDKIFNSICELHNNELVIMALGPTATILASDLNIIGIQALDLGHIDIEYEWYQRGAKEKIPIEGKYVNEAGSEGRKESICGDNKYISQIVSIIS